MKIAFFYRLWSDTGERFLSAADKMGVKLVPIQYDDLVLKQNGKDFQIIYLGEPLSKFNLFYFRSVGESIGDASVFEPA